MSVCFRGNQRQRLQVPTPTAPRCSARDASCPVGPRRGTGRNLCSVVTVGLPSCAAGGRAPGRPRLPPHSGLARAALGGGVGRCGGWPPGGSRGRAQAGLWSLSVSHMVSQVFECYDVHDMRPNWKITHKKVTHAKLLTVDSTYAIFPFGK